MPLVFFDTNIFIYSDDAASPAKRRVAVELFSRHLRLDEAVISLQVLQEYYSAATRKLGIPPERAQQKVELMMSARVVGLEPTDVISAIELHRLRQISFWDALILQAARLAGAKVLYTEDMKHGTTIAGLRLVDPFQ